MDFLNLKVLTLLMIICVPVPLWALKTPVCHKCQQEHTQPEHAQGQGHEIRKLRQYPEQPLKTTNRLDILSANNITAPLLPSVENITSPFKQFCCSCGFFKTENPQTDASIFIYTFHNYTCWSDASMGESCQSLCQIFANSNSPQARQETLCKNLINVTNGMVSLASRVCGDGVGWSFAGVSIPVCCLSGKVAPCVATG